MNANYWKQLHFIPRDEDYIIDEYEKNLIDSMLQKKDVEEYIRDVKDGIFYYLVSADKLIKTIPDKIDIGFDYRSTEEYIRSERKKIFKLKIIKEYAETQLKYKLF